MGFALPSSDSSWLGLCPGFSSFRGRHSRGKENDLGTEGQSHIREANTGGKAVLSALHDF